MGGSIQTRTGDEQPAPPDRFVVGLSEAIGGPLGEHAATTRTGGPRFWTAARIILALTCVVLSLHWIQKSPCRDGAWQNLNQYKYFCYSDVLALYYGERISEGAVPYRDHPVEYPVLTGAFMGVLGLPVHAYGADHPDFNQGQTFYDLNALVLCALGVATVGTLIAMRRRRPWDAAMFAAAPALFVTATVNWDLLAVGLTAFFLYAWAKRRPVIAGILLGAAVAAKFYPLFLVGALLCLAIRSNRWRHFLATTAVGALTWAVVNVPVALAWTDGWRRFFDLSDTRGIDWGTLWYIGAHFPRSDGKYGFGFFQHLNDDVSRLNVLWIACFVTACGLILTLTVAAPRRPRLGQLAFLVIAVFLIFGKVWSQQYVLWLVPLAVLARPRWGAFLAWQAAELGYFVAFYGELMNASGKTVFPEGVFVFASSLRLLTLAVLCGFVVRDILRPEHDVVRRTYHDDPDGGVFDDAPDARWLADRSANQTREPVGVPA